MNRPPIRLIAFTLFELTLAMLISSLVIGIAYVSYSIIQKTYLNLEKKNQSIAQYYRLDQLIRKDFFVSDSLVNTSKGFLAFKSGLSLSEYQVYPMYIIRTANSNLDTFPIPIAFMETSFLGKPSAANPLISLDSLIFQTKIDDLSLMVLYKGDTIPFHYHKKYSSVDLFQEDPHANH